MIFVFIVTFISISFSLCSIHSKIKQKYILDNLGSSLFTAGDFNGDGFEDLLIGANGVQETDTYEGAAYLILGSENGFKDQSIDSSCLSMIGYKSSLTGSSVSSGDVNGDGLSDIIISAGCSPPSECDLIYIIFGRKNNVCKKMKLIELSINEGFRVRGVGVYDSKVLSGGDINRDGFDDIILTANKKLVVLFGKREFSKDINLSNLNISDGFTINTPYDVSVTSLSIGDINKDGYSDIVIGNGSEVFIYFGKNSGFSDIDLVSIKMPIGFKLSFENMTDAQVDIKGDINNDGYDDLLIGMPRFPIKGVYSRTIPYDFPGKVFVFFGKESGFYDIDNIVNITNPIGFTVHGKISSGLLGFSVAHCGDINNDGFNDFVFIENLYDYYKQGSRAYFIYGRKNFSDIFIYNITSEIGFNSTELLDSYPELVASMKWKKKDGIIMFSNDGVELVSYSFLIPQPNPDPPHPPKESNYVIWIEIGAIIVVIIVVFLILWWKKLLCFAIRSQERLLD